MLILFIALRFACPILHRLLSICLFFTKRILIFWWINWSHLFHFRWKAKANSRRNCRFDWRAGRRWKGWDKRGFHPVPLFQWPPPPAGQFLWRMRSQWTTCLSCPMTPPDWKSWQSKPLPLLPQRGTSLARS